MEPRKLEGLEPLEVSLVDKGANRKKRFPVFKKESQDMSEMTEILKAVIDTEVEEENRLEEMFAKSDYSDKAKEALRAAVRIASAYKDVLPADVFKRVAKATGYEVEPENAPTPDPVTKAKDTEEIQKAYDQIEELKKSLELERDIRRLTDWMAKCERDLPYYPAKTEELAKRLLKLEKSDEELCRVSFEEMKAVSKAMGESAILNEAAPARASVSADSAEAKIEKMVAGFVEKAGGDLSQAQAYAKVLDTEAGRALYEQYLSENPAQSGRR